MARKTALALTGACGIAAVCLVGCQKDEIRRYLAPRPVEIHEEAKSEKPKTRMLAALIPHDQHTWFFKLSGPEQAVTAHKEEFDQLLRSVHFTSQQDQPITWMNPEGWERQAGNEMRFATLRLKAKDNPLEISVTDLPPSAASVLPNVNRWRGQLGLPAVSESDLPKVTAQLKIDSATATTVDFTGVSKEGGKMAPFARKPPPVTEPRRLEAARPGVKYSKPEGWQELPPGGFRLAGFRVVEGDKLAEITITPLSAASGSLLANVNRWRGQINLGDLSEDELQRLVREIKVDGALSPYVDMVGRQRVLGVVVARGDRKWYFKMIGDPDLVGKQKPAFESFLESVRFDGGN
jgi:hypothetical protein